MTHTPQIRLVDEATVIGSLDQGETVALNLCFACEAELRERDRFCRRCGASQSGSLATLILEAGQTNLTATTAIPSSSPYATAPLARVDSYRPVSGPLVKAVTASMSASTSGRLDGRYARRAILALIFIPIWLSIILLSPFDAYTTARETLR
jgi:hypothetical protein